MTETTAPDVATVIGRKLAIGWVATYLVTVGLVLASGQTLGISVAVAALPAVFAGPFVGGLLTVVHYHRVEAAAEGH